MIATSWTVNIGNCRLVNDFAQYNIMKYNVYIICGCEYVYLCMCIFVY